MISSKFLASTALAVAVVGSIGLAYAQTAVPTPDSARVETNKATTQPGTNGSTVTTQGKAGATGSTSTTTGTMGSTGTPMRDQTGNLRSDTTNNNTNNTSSGMASDSSTMRTERVARADRN